MKEKTNMDSHSIYQKIFKEISQAKNILLLTHKKPDGDALGSIGALADYLDKKGQPYQVYDFGGIPPHFYFLPNVDYLLRRADQPANFDLAIIVDCGEMELTGFAEELKKRKVRIINIDHHFSNGHYGDINLVMPEADSATSVLTEMLKTADLRIDKRAATYLLTGILTDTSNFANPTTRQNTFQLAAYLMNQGAKLSEITNYTFKNKSLKALRFWGQALMRLRLNQETDVATTVITQKDLKLYDLDEKDVEGLANFLIAYTPHRIIMVLRELDNNQVKGSLRSASEADDVSRLAKALGGGGHKKAAAFVVPGKLKSGPNGWEIV